MGLDIAEIVQQASSRRGSLASEEGRHLRPDELQMYGGKSRSPSPNKNYMGGGGPHRYLEMSWILVVNLVFIHKS